MSPSLVERRPGSGRGRATAGRIRISPPSGKRSRQLLVWLHILSSVSWMSQALALLVLTVDADGGGLVAAHILDTTVLVISANVSAMSGFLLSATTPWGFFVHRWVLVKFLITIGQLVVGIAVLSPTLNDAASADAPAAPVGLVVATAVMASLIAFQGWLSVAKPWSRVPGRSRVKAPVPGARVARLAPFALIGDIALFAVTGQPIPMCSFIVLLGALVGRRATERAGTLVS
ncbi:hypothetical protein [Gordonia sp. GN26]